MEYLQAKRSDIAQLQAPSDSNINDVFYWYHRLIRGFYLQAHDVVLRYSEIPIWPRILEADFAVMYHHVIGRKLLVASGILRKGL